MAPVMTVSGSRLSEFLARWRTLQAAGDAVATQSAALFCMFGEMTPDTLGNQRGQAALQYLLDAPAPPTDIAVAITASASVFVVASTEAVLPPTVPVTVAGVDYPHTVTVVALADASDALRPLVAGKTVGAALKELDLQAGAFAASVTATLRSLVGESGRLVEAAPLVGEVLFTKDEAALVSVKKAAVLCGAVFRHYVRPLIEGEAQSASPSSLGAVREQLCKKLEAPNTIERLQTIPVAEYGMATGLTPCVFHVGAYIPQIQIDPAQLDAAMAAPLRGDVLVVRYGAKNNGYTAFFARTLMFKSKAPAETLAAYEFAYSVSEKIISLLVAGAKVQDVHAQAMAYAKEQNPALAEHLPKSLGFSTGLLVLEARGTIGEKGTATVTEGMSFVVRVTLEGLASGEGGASYAIELADTVVIKDGVAELVTKAMRKAVEVTYEDAAEEEAEDEEGAFESRRRDLSKITRQGQSSSVILSREAQREEGLRRLLRELQEELRAAGGKKASQLPTEELRVYELGRLSFGEITRENAPPPAEARGGRIFVQSDKHVAWFPVFGVPAPFHVSTISKVEVKTEGERHSLTVVFHSLQEANVSYKLNRTKVFLKELNYAAPRDIFTSVKEQLQVVQQRIKDKDASRKRDATTAKSGQLIVNKLLSLDRVRLRPPVNTGRQNKGCEGRLELHANGLRFTFLGGTPIDILFDNVKHTIFQPALNEISVIYHITLKKAVEINRKAVTELQFVADVMESSELASGARRSHEEEMNAELNDEARARATNRQFLAFATEVEKRSHIRTELPARNFHFDGVHTRSMVRFRGSSSVLWAISDWPPFTLPVSEVEVVSFERVIPGGTTFDVTFVMKDYNKPVATLNSIPRQFIDALKDWCLAARLYYMETSVNPNWKVTLKDIRDDATWDPWLPGAGWSVLNNDDDEEDEEGASDSDSDSTYYESEDSEESDSDDSSWLEDEESDVETDEESDASSAVSWDELDRRAEAQDRKRAYSDDDDDRPRKAARVHPPPSRSAGGNGSGPNNNGRPPGGAPPRPGAGAPPFRKTAVPPPRRF